MGKLEYLASGVRQSEVYSREHSAYWCGIVEGKEWVISVTHGETRFGLWCVRHVRRSLILDVF